METETTLSLDSHGMSCRVQQSRVTAVASLNLGAAGALISTGSESQIYSTEASDSSTLSFLTQRMKRMRTRN